MKKILMFTLIICLLTGCKNTTLPETAEITYMRCEQQTETLANKMSLEFEFHNNEIYFMRQIQEIEYETADKALNSQSVYDASSSNINEQYDHVKAYTEVDGVYLYLITEHEINKFNEQEKDLIKLKTKEKDGFLKSFTDQGYVCTPAQTIEKNKENEKEI